MGSILCTVSSVAFRYGSIGELDAYTFYHLLRLRSQVFVVEKQTPRQELDDADTDPSTLHFWADRGDVVLSQLRLIAVDPETVRISRVCTLAAERGHGLAQRLIEYAIAEAGSRLVTVHAHARAVSWFEQFGFTVCGDKFVADGFPHLPMRL